MYNHVIFESDDTEIIDTRIDPTVTYMSLDTETGKLISKEVSGIAEPYDKKIFDSLGIDKLDVQDNSVIIFKYPSDLSPEDAALVRDILKQEFPNNKVIGLTSDIELLTSNPDEAVSMLKGMIAHIQIVNI